MAIIDVLSQDLVARHLSADFLDDVDTAYIMDQLLPAAWEACESFCNRRVFPTAKDLPTGEAAVETDTTADHRFRQAVLLTLGDFYRNREDMQDGSHLNRASIRLLWPLRENLGI